MTEIIRINNPIGLTEEDVKRYATIVAHLGKAQYEAMLDPSVERTQQFIDKVIAENELIKSYVRRTRTLVFEQIMPPSLINECDYVVWKGKVKIKSFRGSDYLVGKVEDRLSREQSPLECFLVRVKSKNFEGVSTFGNYSGKYEPLVIDHQRLYLILDAIEKKGNNIAEVARMGNIIQSKVASFCRRESL